MLLDTASLYFRAFFGVPDSVHGPGRHAGQRRARAAGLHQPGWSATTSRPTWPAAGTTTGVRSGGSTCSRRTRRTGWWPRVPGRRPDIEEVPDPLEAQIPMIVEVLDGVRDRDRRRRRLRGRRRDRHARRPTPAMPVDIVTGDRDLFQLVDDAGGAGALHRPRRRQPRAGDRRGGRREVRRRCPASTPTSRPCAATPPTGCPGVAGVGEKTASSLLLTLRRPARHHRRGRGPGLRAWRPARARRSSTAEEYLKVAPTVVAVARDIDLGEPDLTCPTEPADPEALTALAERWGLTSSVERVLSALSR